jgi:hypothetical protein
MTGGPRSGAGPAALSEQSTRSMQPTHCGPFKSVNCLPSVVGARSVSQVSGEDYRFMNHSDTPPESTSSSSADMA